jgi:alkylated DNA repair dioxygenase AlkB
MENQPKVIYGAVYDERFLLNSNTAWFIPVIKEELLQLEWVTKKTARHEYFMSENERTYSYGNAFSGEETYKSKPFAPKVKMLMDSINWQYDTDFNTCFLNKYDDDKQHLGWHADDFEGMDKNSPIFVVSFGAEREIWVKEKFKPCDVCNGVGYDDTAAVGEPCTACKTKGKTEVTGKIPKDQRILLHEGSLFIMPEGYQDTHLHRIPKHDRPCGWRISLTFRSFK